MTERDDTVSKDDLIREIEAARAPLLEIVAEAHRIGRLGAMDPAGWTVLDHFAHTTAWEESLLPPFQGRPRHEAVSLTEEEFGGDIDASNEILRARTAGQGYEHLLTESDRVHAALLQAIADADPSILTARTTELCPGDPAGERPFVEVLRGDTVEHFPEHRRYIATILASST